MLVSSTMSVALTSLVSQICLFFEDLPCVMQFYSHDQLVNKTDFIYTWQDVNLQHEDLSMQLFSFPSVDTRIESPKVQISIFHAPVLIFLDYPKFFFQAEIFPTLKISYSQVMLIHSKNLSLVINGHGADKFLLKSSHKAIVAIGNTKPYLKRDARSIYKMNWGHLCIVLKN